MAHFYSAEYKGIKITAGPLGTRKFFLLRHLPYWVGDKPRFLIMTMTGNETYLNTLPLFERNPDSAGPDRAVESLGPFEKVGEPIEKKIDANQVPPSGTLEYWINKPGEQGAWKIAEFSGIWKDQFWVILISALAGAAALILLQKIVP
jgi:hypothetical protein